MARKIDDIDEGKGRGGSKNRVYTVIKNNKGKSALIAFVVVAIILNVIAS